MHNFVSLFISFLYMFRAIMYPSSGEITVCDTWYFLFCVDDHLVSYTRRSSTHSDKYQVSHTVISPDDGHIFARNMWRKEINIPRKIEH